MTTADDDAVELTQLEVIRRYSLAVRQATTGRAELVAALRSDLAWLEGGRRASAVKTPARPEAAPVRRDVTSARKAPAPARKPPAPARKPAAKAPARATRRG